MGTGGDFGDNAAITEMEIGLRGDHVTEDVAIVSDDGGCGLVAGGFDGQEVAGGRGDDE
jgi:hypothetical protein